MQLKASPRADVGACVWSCVCDADGASAAVRLQQVQAAISLAKLAGSAYVGIVARLSEALKTDEVRGEVEKAFHAQGMQDQIRGLEATLATLDPTGAPDEKLTEAERATRETMRTNLLQNVASLKQWKVSHERKAIELWKEKEVRSISRAHSEIRSLTSLESEPRSDRDRTELTRWSGCGAGPRKPREG